MSMCGGYLVGIDATCRDTPIVSNPIVRDLNTANMRYMRTRNAGILQVYLKTSSKAQAAFWVPMVNLAIEKLKAQYAPGEERVSVAYGKTKLPKARTTKHHWVIHKFSQIGYDLCRGNAPENTVDRCPWCGGFDLRIDPSYRDLRRCRTPECKFSTYYYKEFLDDDGLTGDKRFDYLNNSRFTNPERTTFSVMRYGKSRDQSTVFNFSFYSGSDHLITIANLVRVLANDLLKQQYLRISSNVGGGGGGPPRTAHAIAMLYNNRSLLQEWGIELVAPSEFACNPREHYHYTDSCILNLVNEDLLREFMVNHPEPEYREIAYSTYGGY